MMFTASWWKGRSVGTRYGGNTFPIAAAVAILLVAFSGFQLVRSNQEAQITDLVETYSQVFAARLDERLQSRLLIAEMIQDELSFSKQFNEALFFSVAETAHRQMNDIQALNWVNPEGVIEIVTPFEGNQAAMGLDVMSLDAPSKVLNEAMAKGETRVTPPISLAQGGHGFVAYSPVFRDNELMGFINLVFRAEALVSSAIRPEMQQRFHVSLYDAEQPIIAQRAPEQSRRFAKTRQIEVGGRNWSITVSPSAVEILRAGSLLDEGVLFIGFIVAIVVGFLANESSQSKRTLRNREERFSLALKGASDGVFDWDTVNGTTYFSPRWFEMLGYQDGELPSSFETFAFLVHPDDVEHVVETPSDLALRTDDYVENEFRMKHKDGSWRTILSRAYTVREANKVVRLVGTHVDITERIERQTALEIAAKTDDLTGLQNRRGLRGSLSRLSQSLESGELLAVFHLDLDEFKSINDRHGHQTGDAALVVVAKHLNRFSDGIDLICRVGGDEFLLARKFLGGRTQISQFAKRLTDEIRVPHVCNGQRIRTSASIGISISGKLQFEDVDQAISDADIALKVAKSMGRGRHVFFEPEMRDKAIEAAQKSTQIECGIERGEFEPYFQPQIELKTGRVTGFESLARWNHPTLGLLPAGEFIPFAEQSNLVEAIDTLMFQKACRALRELDQRGLGDVSVSVNLSTGRMKDPMLADRLLRVVTEEGVSIQNVRIEILENTLLTDGSTELSKNIFRLAEMGFPLELDDFGSGHAAIASLRAYPISRIKIARGLVTNVAKDRQLQAITDSILDLCDRIGIEVLAEGIEFPEDFEYLASRSCGYGQGYLIGYPISQNGLELWQSERGGDQGLTRTTSMRA